METPRICAITGARGYLGSCVTRRFRERGWQIRELSRATGFHLGQEVDPETFLGVEALIHCAYDFSLLKWSDIEGINIGGTQKLLAAAAQAGVGKIVVISTMSAFPGAKSLYGQAKLAIEQSAAEHGALILRPGLIHGENPGAMFGSLVRQVDSARIIPLIGGGTQLLYLIPERELTDYLERYCRGEAPHLAAPITAAHPQPWTFRQILEEIAHGRGRKLTFIPIPWRLVWLALKMAETLKIPLGFRSDSLVSLVHQNPAPDFTATTQAGLTASPFGLSPS